MRLADRGLDARREHAQTMRDRLEQRLREAFPGLVVHGALAKRLPNTLYAAFPGLDANEILARMDGVATGSGAACHSGKSDPSKVLLAMGVRPEIAQGDVAVDDRSADDGGRDRRGRFTDRGGGKGGVRERQGVSRDVVHDGAGWLRVRFPFDRRLVELVKSLPRRRFEVNDKVWSVPEDDVVLLVELLHPEGSRSTRR